jgi:hypothetical protein
MPSISVLVRDVLDQLAALGSDSEIRKPVKSILWPHHSLDTIIEACGRWSKAEETETITSTFRALVINESTPWVRIRNCTHGDLHARNVAVETAVTPYRAFIFDTGTMAAAVNVRDIALLEVTLLLFQSVRENVSLVSRCEALYEETLIPTREVDISLDDAQVINTEAIITEIRRNVAGMCEPVVYAVSIFDHALMEFSGLALQSSRNKIFNPLEAARLAYLSASWLRRIAPELFNVA